MEPTTINPNNLITEIKTRRKHRDHEIIRNQDCYRDDEHIMIHSFDDYDIDLDVIIINLEQIERDILQRVQEHSLTPINYEFNSAATTKYDNYYNVFMYAAKYPELQKLYKAIQDTFIMYNPSYKGLYMFNAWLNVYKENDFIDWHTHGDSTAYISYHGFACINVGNSKTYYKFLNGDEEVVNGRNGLIAFGPSGEDIHRTDPWQGDEPRITIAFGFRYISEDRTFDFKPSGRDYPIYIK